MKFEITSIVHNSNSNELCGRIDLPDKHYVTFYKNPFGNCQIFCIGWINYLLTNIPDNEEFLEQIIGIGEVCKRKRMCMMDVNQENLSRLLKIFEGFIVSKNNYTSTNGSEMVQLLIRVPYKKY